MRLADFRGSSASQEIVQQGGGFWRVAQGAGGAVVKELAVLHAQKTHDAAHGLLGGLAAERLETNVPCAKNIVPRPSARSHWSSPGVYQFRLSPNHVIGPAELSQCTEERFQAPTNPRRVQSRDSPADRVLCLRKLPLQAVAQLQYERKGCADAR